MSEGGRSLRRRSVVILAVIAAAAFAVSLVVARTQVITPDAHPGVASDYPPLLLQGELTERLPWADIATTGSYDGRRDPDNRHEQLQAVYEGEPLYELVGRVDDEDPMTFDVAKAQQGYGIKLVAGDHYNWMVDSRTIVGKSGWVVAKLRDGKPLPEWEGPYRFVGADFIGFRSGQSVMRLVRIRLVPGRVESEAPE